MIRFWEKEKKERDWGTYLTLLYMYRMDQASVSCTHGMLEWYNVVLLGDTLCLRRRDKEA